LITLDHDKRRALADAKARVRELLKPETEARKIARAKQRRAREKRVGQRAPEQRQPRHKEPAYLNWIRSLPCVCCGKAPRSEAAHVRAGYPAEGWRPTGMAEKPSDRRTAPLCRSCHREGPKAQHGTRERLWWQALGIYPPDLCAALAAAYDAGGDGLAVVRRFGARGRYERVD
jgi:hypothetical protein